LFSSQFLREKIKYNTGNKNIDKIILYHKGKLKLEKILLKYQYLKANTSIISIGTTKYANHFFLNGKNRNITGKRAKSNHQISVNSHF
jgi:hypothetical protein